jgi:hypothetical protein
VSELVSSPLKHSSAANAADERQRGGLVSELVSSPLKHSSAANAADERQRGGLVSELVSSPFNTAAPRTRPTSASEEGS